MEYQEEKEITEAVLNDNHPSNQVYYTYHANTIKYINMCLNKYYKLYQEYIIKYFSIL